MPTNSPWVKQGNDEAVADGDDTESVWFVCQMDKNVGHVQQGVTYAISNDGNERVLWGCLSLTEYVKIACMYAVMHSSITFKKKVIAHGQVPPW